MKVFWTARAEKRLDDIYYYYEKEASLEVALKLVLGIIDKTILLEKSPHIGQLELSLVHFPQKMRYLIYKNYKIIYFIEQWANQSEKIALSLQLYLQQNKTQTNSEKNLVNNKVSKHPWQNFKISTFPNSFIMQLMTWGL